MALGNIRCSFPEESSDKCEKFVIKVLKCKKCSILTSKQNIY
jgi:hypothetical protein